MKKMVSFCLLISFLLMSSFVFSATYYVAKSGSDDNSGDSWENALLTISKALDEATSGNSIWVAKGTYSDNHTYIIPDNISVYGGFEGNEKSLTERDIDVHKTIIDGEKDHRCCHNIGLIDGFYFTNGSRHFSATHGMGSGVLNNGRLYNCTVYNNLIRGRGGGVYNDFGYMQNCVVYDNEVVDYNDYLDGAGVYNNGGAVMNCEVYGHTGEDGAGIYNDGGMVKDCIVHDNLSLSDNIGFGEGGYGGGIYNDRGTVSGCSIYNNEASYAGGMYNAGGSALNCLIYGNFTRDQGIVGGLYNSDGNVTNCTIYKNDAPDNGGVYISSGYLTNSIIWNNKGRDVFGELSSVTYSCFGRSSDNNHNFQTNPMFANTSGEISTWDFHLQDGSGCIDAGNPVNAPDNDKEGRSRPGEDGKVCLGAYESPAEYEPSYPGPLRYYVSKSGNNSDGSSWENAYTDILTAISNLPEDALSKIWIAGGEYQEGKEIHVSGKLSLYGGFKGTESDLSERDIKNHKTIIDGQDSHRCIVNYGLLDGLYVKNGGWYVNGAGVYNSGGLITNCVFYSNFAEYVFGNVNYPNRGFGGGIYNYKGNVNHCSIYDNKAARHGGGIYNKGGNVSGCVIYGGNLSSKGAGIYNTYGGKIENCIVYGNTGEWGGGIYNYDIDKLGSSVINCLLYDNSAKMGGGIDNNGYVLNCTVYGNKASYRAGGIYNWDGKVINCISRYNNNSDIEGELSSISHSCFKESNGLNHNIKSDPMFVNRSGSVNGWDPHLKPGSPCIDAGTTITALRSDIVGTTRPLGMSYDMGAYEYSPDNAKFISQKVPRLMNIDKEYQISINVKNIGWNIWTDEEGYHLGNCITSNSLTSLKMMELDAGESVKPDEQTSFTLTIEEMSSPGTYDFQWQMIKEPEGKWFGEKTPPLKIRVYEDIPGDINDDGYLTLIDFNLLREHLLNKSPLTPEEAARADGSEDGFLDVCDLINMMLYRSGEH